jgi:hypothetical protein
VDHSTLRLAGDGGGGGKHCADICPHRLIGRRIVGEREQRRAEGSADGWLKRGRFREHVRNFLRPHLLLTSRCRCHGRKHARSVVQERDPGIRNLPQFNSPPG